jgi:hypothetical protein
MPENGSGSKGGSKGGGFLKQSTAGLPNWAWVLVVVGGVAAAYFIPKLFGGGGGTTSQTATDQTNPNTTGLGMAIDPATGLPYAVEGLVPSGNPYGGSGTDLSGLQNLLTQTLQAEKNVLSQTTLGYIRGRFNETQTTTYDLATPGGVPIRNLQGQIIGLQPYGSAITITGSPITGSSNLPQSGAGFKPGVGSVEWLPVTYNGQTAYVSAYDITGYQNLPQSQAGGTPNMTSNPPTLTIP